MRTEPIHILKFDADKIIDATAQNHEPILILGKTNNAVILSQEDWNAVAETVYLNTVPGMASSIKKMMTQDNNAFSEDIEW